MKRFAMILALGALSGCAGQSIEEMREEALVTGDWSRVERYEAARERDEQFKAATRYCKALAGKYTLVCDNHVKNVTFDIERDCSCMEINRADFGL